MPPTEERMDLHVHAAIKAAVLRQCAERGLTMNEWATLAFCKALGLKATEHAVPRKPMGRPPKQAS